MQHLVKVNSEGKASWHNKTLFLQDIATYKGKDVVLTVAPARGKRSISQNAYYWAVVVEICYNAFFEIGQIEKEDNEGREEAHEYLKTMFLKRTREFVDKRTGEVREVELVGSTTDLNTAEFNAYIENVARFMAEFFDISIPPPAPPENK